jgi:hypothetical protein
MPYKALPITQGTSFMTSASKSSGDARWNRMFLELKPLIASPSDEHPAARVWRGTDLTAVITRVRTRHLPELLTTFPSAKMVIKRMLEMGWLREIPLEDAPTAASATKLYLLDMEATPEDVPTPGELLQGFQPDGVLCYFGALALHELTTQEPAFHHIAQRKIPSPRLDAGNAPDSPVAPKPDKRPRDPLGTFVFRFHGLPCYTTKRDPSLMPGVQTREYGPRTRLRITTLEQTMLDALWQPVKCGGQSVAIEAWERGVLRWNSDRMARHLAEIGRAEWDRRVGAMLSLLGADPGSDALRDRLQTQKARVRQQPDLPPLPLLNGLPATTLLPEWGILTP